MKENTRQEENLKKKDPYLKPVILSGLFITFLSIIFAPGVFLWAAIGGYIAVRLSEKITKETINYTEGILLGAFSGLISGACLDILTLISFKSPENKRLLMKTLEKSWPQDTQLPTNLSDMLPSIFITTCIFIVIISVLFAILGSYIGILISKRKRVNNA